MTKDLHDNPFNLCYYTSMKTTYYYLESYLNNQNESVRVIKDEATDKVILSGLSFRQLKQDLRRLGEIQGIEFIEA